MTGFWNLLYIRQLWTCRLCRITDRQREFSVLAYITVVPFKGDVCGLPFASSVLETHVTSRHELTDFYETVLQTSTVWCQAPVTWPVCPVARYPLIPLSPSIRRSSWEASSRSASQIPLTLQKRNVHYLVHNSPPFVRTLSQFSPVHVHPVFLSLLTYLLTPCSRVLLEKLTGFQLVKKFPAFYGTRKFITALTSARHLSLSWASSI